MKISFVVAVAENGVMGKKGDLPWHIPEDLKLFKQETMGKIMVMGRTTWESLKKKPLPGRVNVVLSRQKNYQAPGAKVFPSKEALLHAYSDQKEIAVTGGAHIFRLFSEEVDTVYLTRIPLKIENGDTFFPMGILRSLHLQEEKQIPTEQGLALAWQKWEKT